MDFVYLETKQFNREKKQVEVKRDCFFNHMFCIKIIHFDAHGS